MFNAQTMLTVPFELHRRDLTFGDTLGSGQYGEVFAGDFSAVVGRVRIKTEVAIKMVLEQANDEATLVAQAAFLKEAAVSWQFDHPNVVRMFGVVTSGTPYLLVLELCENGVLREYLGTTDRTTEELLRILHGAAVGMAHIGTMGVVTLQRATCSWTRI